MGLKDRGCEGSVHPSYTREELLRKVNALVESSKKHADRVQAMTNRRMERQRQVKLQGDERYTNELIPKLQEQFDTKWNQLCELHQQLMKCQEDDDSEEKSEESNRDLEQRKLDVLRHKRDSYLSEIEIRKQRHDDIDQELGKQFEMEHLQARSMIKQELDKTCIEMTDMLTYLEQAVTREEQQLEREYNARNALQMFASTTALERSTIQAPNRVVNDIKRENQALKNKLLEIARKHFQVPTNSSNASREGAAAAAKPQLLTLDKLLQDLLEASNSNRYIELNPSRHWNPFVELLLSCGIIATHPSDSSRVRLEALDT